LLSTQTKAQKAVAHAPQLFGFKGDPIEALEVTKNFLKVPLRGTFKKFFGFYKNVKRCIAGLC